KPTSVGITSSQTRTAFVLRACHQLPRRRRAAECDQQFPPSDGDGHAPLPCEVRKAEDTTRPARWQDSLKANQVPLGWVYATRYCRLPVPARLAKCSRFAR